MSTNKSGPVQSSTVRHACATLALLCCTWSAQAAATITIVNGDDQNEGFNDPTPIEPVGGNSGTTIGAQRLIAFQHAADIWSSTINSSVPIRIGATFDPLPCDANGAVLGSAGTTMVFHSFPEAPKGGAWYPAALASKLSGSDMANGSAHIRARFNSRLGLADCLPGAPFYLGTDNAHGSQIDLVAVLLHEIGHGLGFQTFTSGDSGAQFNGAPSIWDHYLVDNLSDKTWAEMSDAERRVSARSGTGLSWNGAGVSASAGNVLDALSSLGISGVAAGNASGAYEVGDASFGPPLSATAVVGQLMPVVDQIDGTGHACTALGTANARAVNGNIALVDRGACSFVDKARVVQAAGATGMIMADNVEGPLSGMSGTDASITIPSVRITLADGQRLKAVLTQRSRTKSGVVASLGTNPDRLAGTDSKRRVRLYSPSTYETGSSVSHYTVDAKANQLMEPAINGDLSHQVQAPRDLSYQLLQDIGW